MRIAIDAMGGDFAPKPIVEGTLQALAGDPDLSVHLVGDQEQIQPLVANGGSDLSSRVHYDHTTDVVGMNESPAKAMRSKPNSSINRCWRLLAEGKVEGIVSAGNTGAVVAGGFATRRFLPKISRPGIAVTVPTPTGYSIMLDVGANVAPKAEHLFHYGLMGAVFAKRMLGVDKPRIGLLNVGSEDLKGNELAKETQQLYHRSTVRENFFGNIEGRDICRGLVDVIVCDGFVGNIVLKCCEGMVDFLMGAVRRELLPSLNGERTEAQSTLERMHSKYHHSEFGGAPLLGIDGVCLICHGASDERAVRNAIRAAKGYGEVNRQIVEEMRVAISGAEGAVASAP